MRVVKVTESQSAVLTLTDDEAKGLIRSGRRLASDSSWWGVTDDEEGPERRQRSVIRCERDSGDRWRVRVSDAVGLVAVGDLLIEVQPKIPQAHLLYLMEKGGHIPRLGEDRARAGDDRSLWDLVARWFLTEIERVLRRDLMRAYENHCDELKLIRGRVDPARTARSFYTGRIEFACEYDEFTIDNPLNRTLRAAARAVGGSPLLPWSERTRALGALARMEDVGPLRSGDTRLEFLEATTRAGAIRTLESLARIEAGAQGGARSQPTAMQAHEIANVENSQINRRASLQSRVPPGRSSNAPAVSNSTTIPASWVADSSSTQSFGSSSRRAGLARALPLGRHVEYLVGCIRVLGRGPCRTIRELSLGQSLPA